MKVLAIGAHPDDIEIFMYGLLCLLKKNNIEIFMIIATDGSLGGKTYNNLIQLRKDESIEALKRIGIPKFLNLPDSKLGDEYFHKDKLRHEIDEISPDLIITHYHEDYHSDHRNLSKLVKDISSHNFPVLYCDTMMGINFSPNFYFDISEFFEEKKEAILYHHSQKPDRFIKLIELMNGYRSAQCNAKFGSFAEAYFFNSSFPFVNINNILPQTIKIRKFDIDGNYGFL